MEPNKYDAVKDGRGMTSLRARERMIKSLMDQGIKNEIVLQALSAVPRHLFVDEALAHRAYEDTALPIGAGQTISAPYTVAQMTQVLLAGFTADNCGQMQILEIGTGSGYQAAVLAQCVGKVYSIERIRSLKIKAAQRIRQLGIKNCIIKHADGTQGLVSAAPFDAILVTAAAPQIPQDLLDQLKIGGRLIIPLGESEQSLHHIERRQDGLVNIKIAPAKFVPFLEGSVF